jgi:uncharacterized protein (TIGR02453 family)
MQYLVPSCFIPVSPRAMPAFLASLEQNNARNWFEAHRAEYEAHWLGAGRDFIEALSGPCALIGLIARPRLNSSLGRIHCDVRFSKDKRPYEARLHIILSTGEAFDKVPGVHLMIGPEHFGYDAGHYGFEPEALERYRLRMADGAGHGRGLWRFWLRRPRLGVHWSRQIWPVCQRAIRRARGII